MAAESTDSRQGPRDVARTHVFRSRVERVPASSAPRLDRHPALASVYSYMVRLSFAQSGTSESQDSTAERGESSGVFVGHCILVCLATRGARSLHRPSRRTSCQNTVQHPTLNPPTCRVNSADMSAACRDKRSRGRHVCRYRRALYTLRIQSTYLDTAPASGILRASSGSTQAGPHAPPPSQPPPWLPSSEWISRWLSQSGP